MVLRQPGLCYPAYLQECTPVPLHQRVRIITPLRMTSRPMFRHPHSLRRNNLPNIGGTMAFSSFFVKRHDGQIRTPVIPLLFGAARGSSPRRRIDCFTSTTVSRVVFTSMSSSMWPPPLFPYLSSFIWLSWSVRTQPHTQLMILHPLTTVYSPPFYLPCSCPSSGGTPIHPGWCRRFLSIIKEGSVRSRSTTLHLLTCHSYSYFHYFSMCATRVSLFSIHIHTHLYRICSIIASAHNFIKTELPTCCLILIMKCMVKQMLFDLVVVELRMCPFGCHR